MDANELLIRTMKAAKEARDQGLDKTADALDEVVASLLMVANTQAQFATGPRANSRADLLHIH